MTRILPGETDIYALTDARLSLGRPLEEVARALLGAGVKILQYREKKAKAGQMLEECRLLRRLTAEAGACYGVGRALDMVRKAAAAEPGAVRTLGPLIHNPTVVADLDAKGVEVVEVPDQAAGKTLVLRTHGVTPEVEEAARAACPKVIDATCPFVKRAHNAAEQLTAEGYQVIVVGEAGHPEVEGTVGHAPGAVVIGSAAELADVKIARRVGVVVQTTMRKAILQDVIDALIGKAEEIRLVDTICKATSDRQRAAAELARETDVMAHLGQHDPPG